MSKGTITKIGDSIITGITEEKIPRKEWPCPRLTVDDINHHIFPIMC